MPNFAEMLASITGGPILDATGLKGEYVPCGVELNNECRPGLLPMRPLISP